MLAGSTQMRVLQACQLIGPHLAPHLKLQIVEMPSKKFPLAQYIWAMGRPRGSVLFFVKHTVWALPERTVRTLKNRQIKILLDYVDTDLATIALHEADIHVASSLGQQKYLEERLARERLHGIVRLWHHAADHRLYGPPPPIRSSFRAVYVGSANALPEIARQNEKIKSILVSSSDEMASAAASLPHYNFHLALRGDAIPPTMFKPFTKGFNAAACGANLLASRDTNDVVDLLGDDYPYLVNSNEADQVREMLDSAEHGFGSAEWKIGIERMEALANTVSPRSLAQQFSSMVNEVIE